MAKKAKQLEIEGRYIYQADIEKCPCCNERLKVQRYYQWRKTVQQLEGAVYVASRGKECINASCPQQGKVHQSAAAQMVSVPECTYGLDVIAQIGWWRDREHQTRQQIHERLRERGVQLCEREVDHLYAQYEILMGCTTRLDKERLEKIASERGGLQISLDGLEPEGAAEQLWVVREIQTGITLVVGWLPRVNHETLMALLKPVEELGLPLLATVSDKQGSVRKALETMWPDMPHQWCQSHYLGNLTRPIYEHDSALKTEMRKRIRQEIRESTGEILADVETADFSPQLVTGAAVVEPSDPEEEKTEVTCSQVVRDIALDLQQTLTRKGRAPFVMSGVPMFNDLTAIVQTLEQCLLVREERHLRGWYEALQHILPHYQPLFAEVSHALEWVDAIHDVLDAPLPTDEDAGVSGDDVALHLAHCLGQLADLDNLTPWLVEVRQTLFRCSERYWSGLFPCYDLVGLPPTNNDHESLYGQTKRKLRRQRGVSQLREPLLRHGAWAVIQLDVDTPEALRQRLAQVSREDYLAERRRYQRRQEQFSRRYRWRHNRDSVLEQRLADWVEAIPDI